MHKIVVFRPIADRTTVFGKLSPGPTIKRWLHMRLAFLSRNPSGKDHPVSGVATLREDDTVCQHPALGALIPVYVPGGMGRSGAMEVTAKGGGEV